MSTQKAPEETKQDAAFVRDLIAMIGIEFPADRYEADLRDAMFRKAYTLIPKMSEAHVRRINESLCSMKFASDTALAVRRASMTMLAKAHDLTAFRDVKLPKIERLKGVSA